MLKNKTFQIKVVDENSNHTCERNFTDISVDSFTDSVIENTVHVTKYAIATYGAIRVIDLGCKIAEHIVVSKFK